MDLKAAPARCSTPTLWRSDALTVAASLIKRSKPAEWTLFPVQTLETDLTRQISASWQPQVMMQNTGQCCRKRVGSGPGLNVKHGTLKDDCWIFCRLFTVILHPKTKTMNTFFTGVQLKQQWNVFIVVPTVKTRKVELKADDMAIKTYISSPPPE